MRIALIYDRVYPWVHGGGEKTLWDIALELKKIGHEVHYFGTKLWEGPDSIISDGIVLHGVCAASKFYTSDGKRTFVQPLRFGLGLFKTMWSQRKTHFDLINCTVFPYFSVFAVFISRLLRTPRTPWLLSWLEVWGQEYWKYYLKSSWKGFVGFAIEWICSRCCRNHLVISNLQARRLTELLGVPLKSIQVIPRGIEASRLRNLKPEKKPQRVLYTGRLAPYKNVETVVRAWATVVKMHPNATLRILGSGPNFEPVKALMTELGMEDSASIAAPKDTWDEVVEEIGTAEIFVQPSIREGQGVTTLEAMALGTVVVASEHEESAISDYLKHEENGLAIRDWKEPSAWANAITTLLDDPILRARLVEGGRKTAMQFDWNDSISPQLNELFAGLAKQRAR